jgi:hypothetical protein
MAEMPYGYSAAALTMIHLGDFKGADGCLLSGSCLWQIKGDERMTRLGDSLAYSISVLLHLGPANRAAEAGAFAVRLCAV